VTVSRTGKETVDGETDRLRNAYVAWLEAAITASGGNKSEFGRRIKTAGRRGLDRAQQDAWNLHKFGSNTVHGWLQGRVPPDNSSLPNSSGRSEDVVSLPRGHLRSAMADVVEEVAPEPPGDVPPEYGSSFRALADVYAARKHPRQAGGAQRGTEAIRAKAKRRQIRQVEDWLIGSADETPTEIDPLLLNLGSWLIDGSLPPYVPRDADDQLRELVAGRQPNPVVIVGPPKSGKTRSLLEALRMERRSSRVWWVRPCLGATRAIAEAIERDSNTEELVIVLDDLQLHSIGQPPDGLTGNLLTRLTESEAKVIVTIHTKDFGELQAHSLDHRQIETDARGNIGSDPVLAALLSVAPIEYPSALTDDEMGRLPDKLQDAVNNHHLDTQRLRLLGEVLAAVDQLMSICEAARVDHERPHRWAIISAALDGAHLYPSSCTFELLAQLTEWAFTRFAPTKLSAFKYFPSD
jgi:hypothetical protein